MGKCNSTKEVRVKREKKNAKTSNNGRRSTVKVYNNKTRDLPSRRREVQITPLAERTHTQHHNEDVKKRQAELKTEWMIGIMKKGKATDDVRGAR